MSKGDFLGEFEHLVMLAIAHSGGDMGGAGIHATLEQIARRDASLPAIYVTLARLERKGYLRSREAPPAPERGGRSRRLFSLTRAGATELRRTRSALERLWGRGDDAVADER